MSAATIFWDGDPYMLVDGEWTEQHHNHDPQAYA